MKSILISMIILLSIPCQSLANKIESVFPDMVPGQYIVQLKKTSKISQLTKQFAEMPIKNRFQAFGKSYLVLDAPKIQLSSSVIQQVRKNSDVEVVEPNFIYRTLKTPNDEFYEKLWGLKNIGQTDKNGVVGIPGKDIGAEEAWDVTTGSGNMVVAVVDTGVDYNHPDLKDNIWSNLAELNGKPGVDDDNNGFVDDIHGWNFDERSNNPMDSHSHGTHCAGTIGAKGNNQIGVAGVIWNVKIMPIRVLDANGSGSLENAVKGLDYAVKMGAKIISNSWGSPNFSEILKQGVQSTFDAGALFVAAAGNDGTNNDEYGTYPSSYSIPNILAVGALNNQGELAYFSNFGKRKVHVAAPGFDIYSTTPGASYGSKSGTSMATPHTAGIAALVWDREPNLNAIDVKTRLIRTSVPQDKLFGLVKSNGVISANRAVLNIRAPYDENDPDNWDFKLVNVATPDPYDDNSVTNYEVYLPGVKQMSLYFEMFDVEKDYDYVLLYDRKNNVIAKLDGKRHYTYSPIIDGDYVRLELTTDKNVSRHGFIINRVAYR